MSGCAISSAMFAALTDPPYWIRTAAAASAPAISAIAPRIAPHTGLGVLGRRRAAGADRPDRLVGDDERRDLLGVTPGQRGVDLAEDLRLGVARLALLERLADADDRRHARGAWIAADLLGDHLVGLAEQLAPLAVAGDHVAAR